MGKDNRIKQQIKELNNDINDLLEASGGVDTPLVKHLKAERDELLRSSKLSDRGDKKDRRWDY